MIAEESTANPNFKRVYDSYAKKGIDFGPHLGEGGVIVFLTWFLILMSVKLQTSFLTPPFGFTLFYMKGTVPPSITMAHIYRPRSRSGCRARSASSAIDAIVALHVSGAMDRRAA